MLVGQEASCSLGLGTSLGTKMGYIPGGANAAANTDSPGEYVEFAHSC